MPQIERIISRGQLVPLMFTQDAVADAQSAAAMNIIETGATLGTLGAQEYKMPWEFEIVGISILSDSARTAGTLTVDATINGTATGLTAVLDATNTTHHHKVQARDSDKGAAGDRVGVKLTTSSWTPVAADIVVTVWVIAYLEGV